MEQRPIAIEPIIPTQESTRHIHRDDFTRLLAPVQDKLLRFAYTLTRNRDDAQDITAEAVLLGYEQFHTLRDEALFKTWMFTIAQRVFYRALRRSKRFIPLADSDEQTSSMPLPERSAEVSLLYAALDRLPREQRETVVLFEIVGLSLEEIQAVQGGSLSGVKSRLVRGREKLKHLLGEK